MYLIADTRERGFDFSEDTVIQELDVGDYWIVDEARDHQVIGIIERKTWADLAASIKDGRKQNIQKMLARRAESGARLFLLMEGTPPRAGTQLVAGIPAARLQAHIDHLIWRDNFVILQTRDRNHTLKRLAEFMRNFRAPAAAEDAAAPDRSIQDLIARWCALPHFSTISARRMVEANLDPFQIYRAQRLDGPLPPRLDQRQRQIVDQLVARTLSEEYLCKLLTTVRGISRATVERISKRYRVAAVLANEVPATHLDLTPAQLNILGVLGVSSAFQAPNGL